MRDFTTIEYQGHSVRIIRDDGERGGKICLEDICAAIRKPELLRNGTAGELCPSLVPEPDGLHYADYRDARNLLESASRSFWGWRYSVHSMLPLVDALIEEEAEAVAGRMSRDADEASVAGELLFEYGGSTFRARRAGERLMFNATEITRPCGKAPFLWTKLNTTRKLMEYIVENGLADSRERLIESTPGRYGHTWVDHTLLVHLGRWISPEFGEWCGKTLHEHGLYCHEIASVVFESPRRTKMVRTQAAPVGRRRLPASRYVPPFSMPDSLEEARARIEALLPKAEYYEEQVERREWFSNSFIANELGVTIRQLNMFLEQQEVQERRNDKWVPGVKYRAVPLKVAVPYDNPYAVNRSNMRSVWTPYGRDFVHELWNVRHG